MNVHTRHIVSRVRLTACLMAVWMGAACNIAMAQAYTNSVLTVPSPPQTHGAVGSNYVMTTLNPEFQIQDRTGGVVSTMSHVYFWTNGVGIAFEPGGAPYAPRVVYDAAEARWIVSAAADAFTSNAALLVAVSSTPSPTGTWNRYRIDVDTNSALSISTINLGFNRHWIGLHANLVSGTTNTQPVRTALLVFDKGCLYTNGPARHTQFELTTNEWNMAPAITYDPSEDTLYLAHVPRYKLMPDISTVTGPVGSETVSVSVASVTVTTDFWQHYQPGFTEFGPQLGSSNKIDLMDGRIRDLVYRNNALWMCHTIFLPYGDVSRSAVQWWQVETNGTVLQRGQIDDPTSRNMYAYPSMAVNSQDDVLIGFSAFSTSYYPSAAYAYRTGSDPPGTTRPPYVYKHGEAPYRCPTTLRNAWGEYSATVVDPLGDTNMWTIQQYAHSPENRWGTWWATVTAPDQANLTLSKTADVAQVPLGSNVTYTIVVTNQGPAAADVTIVDTLPSQLTFVSAISTTTGSCTEADGEVTCHVGILASNESAVLTLTAMAITPGEPNNSATAWTGVETDTNHTDNTDTASVWIPFDVLPDVWINEIHYDDTNGIAFVDTDEGVEIAGPAGTVLDGLKLIFYEGSTQEVYTNRLLTGVIDHETNGYGAVWFDMTYLYDGRFIPLATKGDGIALVPPGTGIIQFISYEGYFTATNGQAAGLTATNIGVEESGSTTPPGYALQLIGNGIGYSVFAWQSPAQHSRGELNPGQTIPVDADGDGIPSWWEYLYFGGPTNADPTADGDSDGLNEEGEYTADTHPGNSTSRFFIATVTLSNTWPVITFDTSAQRVYGLESSTNLLTNLWYDVHTNLPGVGGPLSVPDTNFPSAAHFYRGRVRVP